MGEQEEEEEKQTGDEGQVVLNILWEASTR
jgi:hypothetical protein